MKIQGNPFLSIEQLQDQYLNGNRPKGSALTQEGLSFQDILSGSFDVPINKGI